MAKRSRPEDAAVEKGVEAAAAMGVAAATAPAGSAVTVAVAAMPALLGWAVDRISTARQKAAEERVRLWLENVAAAMEFGSKESVQQEFDEHIDEPWARDGLLESFRHLSDCLSEDVIPSLGRLTADYLTAERPPDAFFRCFGGMLAGLDPEAFVALLELVEALGIDDPLADGAEQTPLTLTVQTSEHGQAGVILTDHRYEKKDSRHERFVEFVKQKEATRLFSYLKTANLGVDNASGYVGSVAGPHVIVIDAETIARMRRYLAA